MGLKGQSSNNENKQSIYLPELAKLVQKRNMTPFDTFFEFEMSRRPLGHRPGQFVEVSIPGIGEAPISVSSAPSEDNRFQMVIRNVGTVTQAIHNLAVGDFVGIRGPFGTSFPVDELKGKNILFIAGGIGLVPARSAIQYVLAHRQEYRDVSILFGCKDPAQRLFTDELQEWSDRRDVVFLESVDTVDLAGYSGKIMSKVVYPDVIDACRKKKWPGNTGVITTLIPRLEKIDPKETTAIIVGPPVMYKFVIMSLQDLGFANDHIIVSLERRMKCGVGKCGHCQMNHLYVCQTGPVYYFSEIHDIREAI